MTVRQSFLSWRIWVLPYLLTIVMLFTIAPGGFSQEATPSPAPSAAVSVVLEGETLFEIKAQIASFSPRFRAQVISDRIQTYAKTPSHKLEPIKVQDNEVTQTVDIVAGDQVLMTVAEVDAVASDVPRRELAQNYATIISERVKAFHKAYSFERIIRGIGLSAIATVVFIMLLIGLGRLIPWSRYHLRRWRGTRIAPITVLGKEILSAHRIVSLLLEMIKFGRLLLWLTITYLYINLVLSFFPWTVGLSRRMFSYLTLAAQGITRGVIDYLPNLFVLVLTTVITIYVLKITRFIFLEIESGSMTISGFYPEWAKPTSKLVQFLVLVFAVIVAFPYLPGAQSPAFQGISIFLGLLFSLGSSSAISNVISGVILTYTRAFKVGDRVKISDTIGDIIEKTLFVTRIQTIKNVVITIPNASILANHIVNYSAAASDSGVPPLILSTTITLGYDVPWKKVHEALVKAALATSQILSNPPPFVLQTSLDDFFVSYELNAYTSSPGIMAKIYSELHQNIQDCCNAANIEILSPHYRAVRDGNMTAIPAPYLNEDDQPPSFRIAPNILHSPDEKRS